MYAMATLMQILLGWDFNFSIVMSAIIVLAYTFLGGLTSAIIMKCSNFSLSFRFYSLGFLVSRTRRLGGVQNRLHAVAAAQGFAPTHGREAGRTWVAPAQTQWVSNGSGWCSGSASFFPLDIGARTF